MLTGGANEATGERQPVSVVDVARLLIPGDLSDRPLAICTGFGAGESSPITLAAGFLGVIADWRACEDAWGDVLNAFGVSPRRVRNPALLDAKLEALGKAQRKKFIHAVAELIGAYGLFGRAAFLRSDDFQGLLLDPQDRARFEQLKHDICLGECLEEVMGTVAANFTRRDLTLVMKSGGYDTEALRVYEGKRSRNGAARGAVRLSNILFSSREEFGALQVMDILGYSIYLMCLSDDAERESLTRFISIKVQKLPIHVIQIDARAIRAQA
jgi:hypothetical protein